MRDNIKRIVVCVGLVIGVSDLLAKDDSKNQNKSQKTSTMRKNSPKKQEETTAKESKPAIEENSNWSNYLGSMSWEEAKVKCVGLGLKLPTIKELKDAYDAQSMKSWVENTSYWSSTPAGNGTAYEILTSIGLKHDNTVTNKSGVRCMR